MDKNEKKKTVHHNAHSKKTGRIFTYGICIVAAIIALAAIYIAYMLNKFAGTGAMAGVLIAAAAVCFLRGHRHGHPVHRHGHADEHRPPAPLSAPSRLPYLTPPPTIESEL